MNPRVPQHLARTNRNKTSKSSSDTVSILPTHYTPYDMLFPNPTKKKDYSPEARSNPVFSNQTRTSRRCTVLALIIVFTPRATPSERTKGKSERWSSGVFIAAPESQLLPHETPHRELSPLNASGLCRPAISPAKSTLSRLKRGTPFGPFPAAAATPGAKAAATGGAMLAGPLTDACCVAAGFEAGWLARDEAKGFCAAAAGAAPGGAAGASVLVPMPAMGPRLGIVTDRCGTRNGEPCGCMSVGVAADESTGRGGRLYRARMDAC
jgi:hypothetical protein